MKSRLTNIEPTTIPFPKLMWAKGELVVLMTHNGHGVVVAEDDDYEYCIGYYGEWDMSLFQDYDGSVTLQN